jgi:hypothetical protein
MNNVGRFSQSVNPQEELNAYGGRVAKYPLGSFARVWEDARNKQKASTAGPSVRPQPFPITREAMEKGIENPIPKRLLDKMRISEVQAEHTTKSKQLDDASLFTSKKSDSSLTFEQDMSERLYRALKIACNNFPKNLQLALVEFTNARNIKNILIQLSDVDGLLDYLNSRSEDFISRLSQSFLETCRNTLRDQQLIDASSRGLGRMTEAEVGNNNPHGYAAPPILRYGEASKGNILGRDHREISNIASESGIRKIRAKLQDHALQKEQFIQFTTTKPQNIPFPKTKFRKSDAPAKPRPSSLNHTYHRKFTDPAQLFGVNVDQLHLPGRELHPQLKRETLSKRARDSIRIISPYNNVE